MNATDSPALELAPAEAALARAEWQKSLFAETPRRLDLARLTPGWPLQPVRFRVHRNHAFEHIASATRAWFAFASQEAVWTYSDYDDALSFGGVEADAEIAAEIVWLDLQPMLQRVPEAEALEWLLSRLKALRALTNAPVLVATIGFSETTAQRLREAGRTLHGVRLAVLEPLLAPLAGRAFDARAEKLSGTRLSEPAMLLCARELACRWLPALTAPRLKAIAVDLDQTLYSGVLGEDGDAVVLTEGHRRLQEKLVALREEGLFLAAVSKNEREDVERLFAARHDFPLRWEHFSASAISWADKATGLAEVARALRIGTDSILFIDDNPGELAAVSDALPTIHTLHVEADAAGTGTALDFYPRIWAWERTATDAIRAADLQADAERGTLAAQHESPEAYLRSLQVELTVACRRAEDAKRTHELSQKTNQFNLNLARLGEVAVAEAFERPDQFAVTIALKDRLSDSGIVGAIVGRTHADALEVIDLLISCRALGRRLEDLMIFSALQSVAGHGAAPSLRFHYRRGPRNQPALDWLARVSGAELQESGEVTIPLPPAPLTLADAVTITTL